jgi:hypothetical protein
VRFWCGSVSNFPHRIADFALHRYNWVLTRIGLLGAAAASGLLRSFLFGVSPFDPVVLTMAAVAVLLLALAASALPATRAASIDPMQSLRGE